MTTAPTASFSPMYLKGNSIKLFTTIISCWKACSSMQMCPQTAPLMPVLSQHFVWVPCSFPNDVCCQEFFITVKGKSSDNHLYPADNQFTSSQTQLGVQLCPLGSVLLDMPLYSLLLVQNPPLSTGFTYLIALNIYKSPGVKFYWFIIGTFLC